MGTLKKFANWLAGESTSGGTKIRRGKKGNVSAMITKLKLFNKRLQRQARSLGNKSNLARRRAVDARKKGDIDGSKMQMRHSLQFAKWKNGVEAFQLRLEGLQYKLEQAKAVGDIQGILQGIVGTVAGLKKQISAPEISNLIKEIDIGIEDFDTAAVATAEGMDGLTVDTEIDDGQVEDALAQVDAELMVEQGAALPSPEVGVNTDELEEELRSLKEDK
ncbi:MAG: hypothetical protein ACTSU5_16280 [Promethearchaeota archaeon]